MDLNYCLNFESDWSFRRHYYAEENRILGWYVMEVVVVIVDHLVTIQLDVRDRITGDDTDLASSSERRTSEPGGERCGD